MDKLQRSVSQVVALNIFPLLALSLIVASVYYKFFIFGKIPFPGDLLVASYSPWFDYYKIPVQNPLISDVFSQLILWKYLSIDIFKSGQWPLWNPFSFTGNPLLATYQSATLYPLNTLLFLPKYFGWGIFIFSQTLLASINMYLLLSIYVNSRLARVTGAMIFAFGGLMTTWMEQGIPVHGIIWLPLSLYFVEKFLLQKRLRYLLFLTASLTLSALAGHFQMMTYTFSIVLIYSLVKTARKNILIFLPPFLAIVFSMLLATALSSPQLLPSFDLFQKSIRLTESYSDEFKFGLLPWADFIKFFVADFFGNPVTRNYWGFLNYFETSGFVGTLSLSLLIFSFLFLKRNKLIIFFLALFVISCILTFQNPLSLSFYQLKLPILTASFASRMLFVTVFSIGVLSALSINQVLSLNEGKRFLKTLLYSLAALAGVAIGVIISKIYVIEVSKTLVVNITSKKLAEVFLKDANFFLENIETSFRNILLPLFLISVLWTGFIIIHKIRLSKSKKLMTVCSLLLILLIFDLSRYFLKFNPFVPENLIFPTVPALAFLKDQPGLFRVGREHAEIFPPNTWIAYKIQSPEGYDPIYLGQYGKFMRFLNGGNLKSGTSSRYAEVTSNYYSPYLDAANVKYFIALLRDKSGQIPGDELDWRFKESPYEVVFKDKSAAILRNPNAMERVYFAKNILYSSPEEIENLIMRDKNFNPKETVALSRDLNLKLVTGKGSAKILEYSPNTIKVKTNTSSEEILILTDQYEDGWRVKIDNTESIISPANLIFRAVKVPSGEHEVTFTYAPKSFDIGLKISIGTLLVISLFTMAAVKKRYF